MTRDEKIKAFINIIKVWFRDFSGKIDKDNCVDFYNYFLDSLEFEYDFSPEPDPGFKEYLNYSIRWLCGFDKFLLDEPQKENIHSETLMELYKQAKAEYFLP